ncbi:MAG: two-component regulator propeller domain-containing protein [Candidatus Korobacteraceae bacterium]
MGKAQTKAVVCLLILLTTSACALELDPSLDISQYSHTAWKVREGFTRGTIFSMAQTPDGYLWLGTEFGLVRFDGVQAVPWQPPNGEQLPSNFVQELLVARDGTLWIGTDKGLASWKDGEFTQYPGLAGYRIYSLLQDTGGTIWFAAENPGRICAVRVGIAQCQGDGSFGISVSALYEDHEGNLWVSAQTGLWRWAPGPPEHYGLPEGVQADELLEDDNGVLLMTTNKSGRFEGHVNGSMEGLKQLVAGKIRDYTLPAIAGQFTPLRLFRSSDGGLWIGTVRGLLHLYKGRIDGFSVAEGLSGDLVTSIFEDREGSVWVSTSTGLDRFRQFAMPTISVNQGLSIAAVDVLQATPDGSIWIATADGLNRWQDGHMTVYGRRNVQRQNGRTDQQAAIVNARVTEVANSGLRNKVNSLGQDDLGRLWAESREGVFYFDRGRFVQVPGLPGGDTSSIVGEGHGKVWISNFDQGLIYSTTEGAVQRIPWARFGHTYPAVALLPDRLQGGLWLGFVEGGIAYLKDGQVRASYNTADGLGHGAVMDLRLGSDGALWASTEGGLSRVKDGRITTLTSKNGLPCDAVQWAIEDNDHSFWLDMPCGLLRIARSELDAWVSDSKRAIQTKVFDSSDGVWSFGRNGSHTPYVTKSPDGRIWFSAPDGVSVINPHHLAFNKLPPPVHVEQIIADHKNYDTSSQRSRDLRLPPHVRDLEIDYTALSLVAPEKVRFRYKLEGLDSDWHDVGNRRQAFYTNLPPRNYRFRVIACNNSGVWNEQGASLDFSVAAAYYQTNWFLALCAVAFLALVYGAYRFRVRQLRHQEKKLRDVIETIPTFAWTALPDGSIDFANRNWEEYSGFSSGKTAGSGWEEAVHPADLKRHVEKWSASVAAGETFEGEVRFRRTDGEYRWFLVRAVPLRDARGKIVKWYGTSTDIEDRKRAEEERERLQADLAHVNRVSMMGELAASLSHELKQPITATVTNAKTCRRWLQRDQPDLEEACEATDRIVEDGKRAADIIDRLRSLYKKAPPQRELVGVNEIVKEMIVLLRGEAHRYGVSIRTDLAADLPKITADRVQLQQVLMNLMLNAIEAMKETGGVLTLTSLLDQEGRVLISVSDTGVGLPAEKADEIFNAFFTTKAQGSGMGLAISRNIVESHGGRLWATANDGRGATFHFSLPVAAGVANAPAIGR